MDINQTDYQNSIQKNKNSLTENFPNLSYLNIETNKINSNFPFPNQSYKIPNSNIQNSIYNPIQLSQNKYKQKVKNTNLIDENNNENSQEKKEDIHRRSSKNDIERRTFICQLCGKSYLSYHILIENQNIILI